jgi:hypothetical protein
MWQERVSFGRSEFWAKRKIVREGISSQPTAQANAGAYKQPLNLKLVM